MPTTLDPIQYLRSRLQDCARYSPTPDDLDFVKENGIEGFLYKTLLSKKFRKWKVSDEYSKDIHKQVEYVVANKQPITGTWFFGGYKLWSLASAPEVDWAEFFSIAYFLSYLAPIAALYPPGAKFEFWAAHASIMQRQSNIAPETCRIYRASFAKLLDIFRPHLPENFKIELHSFDELYPNEAEYQAELEPLIASMVRSYEAEWSPELKERKAKTSAMNIQWPGAEDWTKLSEMDKQVKIRLGPIVHDGYCRLARINQAIRGPGKLDLSATPLPSGSIPIGTASGSVTKFWTGLGVLEQKNGKFNERILSPQQIEEVKQIKHAEQVISLIPLKNFEMIRIYPELRFSNRSESRD